MSLKELDVDLLMVAHMWAAAALSLYTCHSFSIPMRSIPMRNLPVRPFRSLPSRVVSRGFTLIEIMVVVVIMGILAALVVPKLMGRTDDARITAARQDIATLMQALKLYKLDNQRYPTTQEGLQVLVAGHYIPRLPEDPWLRVHVRAGGRIVGTCKRAMVIPGLLDEWRSWTGLPFDVSGPVVVPGALVPVQCSVEHDYAVYVEPGVWVHHKL